MWLNSPLFKERNIILRVIKLSKFKMKIRQKRERIYSQLFLSERVRIFGHMNGEIFSETLLVKS